MKKRTSSRKILVILLSGLFSLSLYGQDVHFSQTEYMPLNLNPALAGGLHDLSVNTLFKTQWSSVATPYETFGVSAASVVNPMRKITNPVKLAVGIDFYNDWAGDAKMITNSIRLHFATHIKVEEEHSIGLGVYGGYGMRSIDFERGQWGSQYDGYEFDPSLPTGESFAASTIGARSLGAFDVGAGLFYSFASKDSKIRKNDSKKINVGFSAYHLNRPNYHFLNTSDERQYMRFSAFFSSSFGIEDTRISVLPSIYYHRQGPANELLLGAYVKYLFREVSERTVFIDEISGSVGLFYRNLDALILKLADTTLKVCV